MAARSYTLKGRLERKTVGDVKTARRLRYVVLRLDDTLQSKLIEPGAARVRIRGQLQGCVYVDRPKGAEARRAKALEVVDRVRRGLLGQRDACP